VPASPCGAPPQSPWQLPAGLAPPLRMAPLPERIAQGGDLDQAASGRASKITPTTPAATLTRSRSQALHRVRCAVGGSRGGSARAAPGGSLSDGRRSLPVIQLSAPPQATQPPAWSCSAASKISPGWRPRWPRPSSSGPAHGLQRPCLPLAVTGLGQGHRLLERTGWPVAADRRSVRGRILGRNRNGFQEQKGTIKSQSDSRRVSPASQPARPHCPGHSGRIWRPWRLSGSTAASSHFNAKGRQKWCLAPLRQPPSKTKFSGVST